MVGEKGLEPSQFALLVPKTNASTNSATRPNYCCFIYYCSNLSNPNNSVKRYNYIKKMIISPCISICKTDPDSGYCYGCARNNEEKKVWKDKETTEEWKKNNIKQLQKRMNALQLKNFMESYEFKSKNGISLIKYNKLNEKK